MLNSSGQVVLLVVCSDELEVLPAAYSSSNGFVCALVAISGTKPGVATPSESLEVAVAAASDELCWSSMVQRTLGGGQHSAAGEVGSACGAAQGTFRLYSMRILTCECARGCSSCDMYICSRYIIK